MEKEFIKILIQQLNKSNVKYVFTGSFALAYYGFPRASLDTDIIIERNKVKLLSLAEKLKEKGFNIQNLESAIEKGEHFAVFYKDQFPYFDFKIARDVFDEYVLGDYTIVNFYGEKCRLVSPEALIVKKLEWEDYKDVRSILQRYGGKLNMKKLFRIARIREVDKKLQQLLEKEGM